MLIDNSYSAVQGKRNSTTHRVHVNRVIKVVDRVYQTEGLLVIRPKLGEIALWFLVDE